MSGWERNRQLRRHACLEERTPNHASLFHPPRISQYAVRLLLPNRRKGLFLPLIPQVEAGGNWGREWRMSAEENCSGAQFSSAKKAAYSVDLSFHPALFFVKAMQFCD
jgi:hypothetical protein